jgi:hypothetical protein
MTPQASKDSGQASKVDYQTKPSIVRESEGMLSLLAASQIAGIAGNAVSIIDKVYAQFIKVKTQSSETPSVSPQTSRIENHRDKAAILSKNNGQIVQSVAYDQLQARLEPSDLDYIKAKERALNNHYRIWLAAYPQISVISDPVVRATAETSLEDVAGKMGAELSDILDFLEQRIGLSLDDHYQAIRQIARQ